jgi:formylglycine-generating enzyme
MKVARSLWQHPMVRTALGLAGLGLCAIAVATFALGQRRPPERCPEGMQLVGKRCCGEGQVQENGACRGPAERCSIAQEPSPEGACVARFGVVSFEGGELFIGAADWDGASSGERFPRVKVKPFRLDASEVTHERYRSCLSCEARSAEPGLPVTNIAPESAEAYCRSQHGRLPTSAEWVFAAAGTAARRYAWGNSGLVCRRAAFGLLHGPCETDGGPELSGSRPDGASPDGVHDLAGNVAEWTLEPDGSYVARGGSFRSSSAAELKSWAVLPDHEKALHIGFRCAYPP